MVHRKGILNFSLYLTEYLRHSYHTHAIIDDMLLLCSYLEFYLFKIFMHECGRVLYLMSALFPKFRLGNNHLLLYLNM